MSYRPTLFLCENCGDFKPESQRSLTGNCTDCDPEIEYTEQELDEMRRGNFNRSEYGGPETKPFRDTDEL